MVDAIDEDESIQTDIDYLLSGLPKGLSPGEWSDQLEDDDPSEYEYEVERFENFERVAVH